MGTKIFVNLPVRNLKDSIAFFTKLGFAFNPRFTDENATCMIIGEENFVMLLMEDFFKTFTSKGICQTKKDAEVIVGLSAESREKVDEMVEKALAAGGKKYNPPNDQGFMYSWSFQDLDDHLWEVLYMAESGNPGKKGS